MKVFTWNQRFVVYSVTLLCVGLFGLAGYGVGSLLGSGKIGIVVGVLASYPFAQFALVQAIKRLRKHETNESRTV